MSDNKKETWRGSVYLMLASLIWGVAFVAQRVGMDYVDPFTFNGVRNLMGGIVLLPCMLFIERRTKTGAAETDIDPAEKKRKIRMLFTGGFVCGFFLFIASNLQQFGIKYTSVGKAGFITAMYIVLVPVLGFFLGQHSGVKVWISVVLGVAGLYLLCLKEDFRFEKGDIYTLLCALAFAFQILAVSYYSKRTQSVQLAIMEFLICGLLTMIPAFLFEKPSLQSLWRARLPLLYAGILSCGVAYTLQIMGQKRVRPALASLIMSFEAVISVLAGWLILHQTLTVRELAGCAVMFAAIIFAQI